MDWSQGGQTQPEADHQISLNLDVSGHLTESDSANFQSIEFYIHVYNSSHNFKAR